MRGMYRLKRMLAAEDLAAFKAGYEQNLAERSSREIVLSLPLSYLSSSEVTGIVDERGELLGGFVMRYAPPFRCLQAVPDDVQRGSPLLRAVPEADMCELTCIWRDRGLPTTRFATRVWPRIIARCVRSKRRLILGLGFDNRMNDTYQVWSPHLIYRGPSAAADTATTVHVFAFGRARIVANFVTNFALQVPVKLLRSHRAARA
jgi:hypothetical protein